MIGEPHAPHRPRKKPLLRPRPPLRQASAPSVGGVAARMASGALRSAAPGPRRQCAGARRGARRPQRPIMKVAQLLATIPDALPPEYANELIKLQSQAPPMGWAFVKRRMQAELGAGWEKKFASFEHHPAAAASLGQVHKARALDGAELGLQAAISRHAVGGRSRPAASCNCCSPSASASIRPSTPPRSRSRSARACARSSTTSARPSTSRSIARCSQARPRSACRRSGRSFRPAGC